MNKPGTTFDIKLGKAIKKARLKGLYNVVVLADLVGVSQSQIYHLEEARSRWSTPKLFMLLSLLRINPKKFIIKISPAQERKLIIEAKARLYVNKRNCSVRAMNQYYSS